MCRHLARIGPPVTLTDALVTPPHSLQAQSYAPRRQRHGRVNADGFGVGWYVAGRAEPVRFRRAQPMWSDRSFAAIAEVTPAGCLLAAVRSATPAYPVEESSAAPFTDGPWLFSHNGVVADLRRAKEALADRAADVVDAQAPVDSAFLFALAVAHWHKGESLAGGLAATVGDVLTVTEGRLNLLATDGSSIAATAYGESLFLLERDAAVVVASEPYDDDPEWTEVPDGTVLCADAHGVTLTPLTLETL